MGAMVRIGMVEAGGRAARRASLERRPRVQAEPQAWSTQEENRTTGSLLIFGRGGYVLPHPTGSLPSVPAHPAMAQQAW